MTKTEVVKLMAVAVSCFPSMMERDMKATAEGWFQMLGDLDYNIATAALKTVLATAKFFPSVAEIREAAVSLMPNELPPVESAWGEVLRAMQAHGHMKAPQCMKSSDETPTMMVFSEPWDFSNPLIGETVKQMWGSWRNACEAVQTDTLGVDRAQFTKMYSTVAGRKKELAQLPPAVRELASGLADMLKLPASQRKVRGGDHGETNQA